MFDRILQKLKLVGKKGLDILFKPADTPLAKWLVAILLGALFIVGLLHWGYFLNWFNNQFNIGDWHIIDGPILIFLAKAFRSGQLPMHAVSPLIVPDRYLGRPDRSLSPQILLLYFLDPATYVVVNVWIFYTIGFIALLLIRRRYRLSPASFLLLYLLFNFNGDVTAHLAVGHMDWVGYFLLPFFVLLVLKMLEGEKTGWVWVFIVALTMLAVNFQGSVHIFLYCMAFLLFLAVFQPRYWAPVLKAIIASSLISMIKLLPLSIQYYGSGGVPFIYGFLSVEHLVESFIVLHPPYILDTPSSQLGGWEVDYYLGLLGFAFVAYFGVIRSWVNQKTYRALYFPMLAMTLFSLGDMYRPIFNSPIPFMDSQRAPSRFILIPVVFLIILAGIQFESFIKDWDRERWREKSMVLFGTVFIGVDLLLHSLDWRLANISAKVIQRFTDVIQVTVVNRPDPPYVISLIIGLAVTVIALVVLAILAIRERNALRLESPPIQ
jgi:hypothetical protein